MNDTYFFHGFLVPEGLDSLHLLLSVLHPSLLTYIVFACQKCIFNNLSSIRTQLFDLLRPSLHGQLDFRNFSHLHREGVITQKTNFISGVYTKLVVFAFSSGVFSNRL